MRCHVASATGTSLENIDRDPTDIHKVLRAVHWLIAIGCCHFSRVAIRGTFMCTTNPFIVSQ